MRSGTAATAWEERRLTVACRGRQGSATSSGKDAIAGFVEPGDTLEECVVPEVKEEVGLTVGNIRYCGSQPWPFPHSLMLGFTAEYVEGELELDPTEIAEAGWFRADALPSIPGRISIAGRLIQWFVEKSRPTQ